MPRLGAAIVIPQQPNPPAAPPSGWMALYVGADGLLWTRNPAGVIRPVPVGAVFPFSRSGTLETGQGAHRLYNDTGFALTIRSVRASVGTPPTGAPIIVDVNVNGATIFTTQANRPTIPAGQNTSGAATGQSVTTIPDGGYFTVDIDQVGSTQAGADLTVQILCI